VPIELLDVAGLVPGAHEGKGLGNRFLDDLRHADGLIHVVDVSGSTDAEGWSEVHILSYIEQKRRALRHRIHKNEADSCG
jgi:ribosome-binding ATPase YchF (GTP1/OBG family)